MPTTRLSDPRVKRVLESRDIATLATVQPDGSPLALAMWFVHDAEALAMISVDGLQKVKNLRRDPRVSIAVETQDDGVMRCVTVQGRAEFIDEAKLRRPYVDLLFKRYGAKLEGRWAGREIPADRVLFRILPEKVFFWDPGGR